MITTQQGMKVEIYIYHDIQKRQLALFGHVKRMNEERLPNHVLRWTPSQRKKRGHIRHRWQDYVDEATMTRNSTTEDCQDRGRQCLEARRSGGSRRHPE
ncbi:hypothetical protein PR048_006339 [Dryococelus australis]|uniref:Uncharacterized protein n=1 Tax=Dryococelus australis TaxID=614101 RepID=A0ABQ9IBY2_9NEOP|nr:hypothetical protein PR048_006339 [Dryococelus australis]